MSSFAATEESMPEERAMYTVPLCELGRKVGVRSDKIMSL